MCVEKLTRYTISLVAIVHRQTEKESERQGIVSLNVPFIFTQAVASTLVVCNALDNIQEHFQLSSYQSG